MFNLVKSIAQDFPNGITHHHLINEIIEAGINYCNESSQVGDQLIIHFTSDYTSDLNVINSVITNYKPVPAFFDDLKFVTITSADSPYQIIKKSVKCNTTGGNITLILPLVQRAKKGIIAVYKIISASNTVTIQPNGSDTINGTTTPLQLTDLKSYFVLTNNGISNWVTSVSNRLDLEVNNSITETSSVGDILVDNGNELEPLHIGSNGQALIVDTADPLKLRWANISGTGGVGTGCTEISATSVTSTISSTYNVISGMTSTPSAGMYVVLFSSTGSTSKSSAIINYGIFINGTLVDSSERTYRGTTSTTHTLYTQAKVTVNGSQTIDIRYKTSDGTFTVGIRNMLLLN